MTGIQKSPSPYHTTIDWQRFVVEIDGQRGISLRRLVEVGGLYEQMSHAARALRSSGLGFCPVQDRSSGGRPANDYLLDFRDAVAFAAKAQTDVGRTILDLLISHHAEFQKLLDGDAEAIGKLADTVANKRALPAVTREQRLLMTEQARSLRAAARSASKRGDHEGAQALNLQAAEVSQCRVPARYYPFASDRPQFQCVEIARMASTRTDRVSHQKVSAVARTLGLRDNPKACREVLAPDDNGIDRRCPLFTRTAADAIVKAIRDERRGAQLRIVE